MAELETFEKLELFYTSNYIYQGYQGHANAKAKASNNGANSLFFVLSFVLPFVQTFQNPLFFRDVNVK
jgi:hypothetical protein